MAVKVANENPTAKGEWVYCENDLSLALIVGLVHLKRGKYYYGQL